MKRLLPIICLAVAASTPLTAQHVLTLDSCRNLALRGNAAVVTARLDERAAAHARTMALTRYFPTVDAGVQVFRADKELVELHTSGGNLPVYDGNPAHIPIATEFAYLPASTTSFLSRALLGSVDIVQPVFAGGRIIAGNRLAALNIEVVAARRMLAEQTVARTVEEHWWRVVMLREKRRTLDAYETMLGALERQVADAVAAGLTVRNDLLRVQLARADVRADRSKLENGITLATMALCQYVGIPYADDIVLADSNIAVEDPRTLAIDHAEAVRRRPEYQLLAQSVNAAELQTDLARGEYLPSLAVGVTGRYIQLDRNDGRTLAAVFGTLSVPLSAWWGGAHDLERHALATESARTTQRNSIELLQLEMDKVRLDLDDAWRQIDVRTQARAQAAEHVALARDAWRQGVGTLADLLEAEADLQHTDDRLVEARTTFRTLLMHYLQITGR
jgi:outer membrane protein